MLVVKLQPIYSKIGREKAILLILALLPIPATLTNLFQYARVEIKHLEAPSNYLFVKIILYVSRKDNYHQSKQMSLLNNLTHIFKRNENIIILKFYNVKNIPQRF